jgi:hypothetical protein
MPRQLINKYGQVADPDLLQVNTTIKEALSKYITALPTDITITELHTISYVVMRTIDDCISCAIFNKAVDESMSDLNPTNASRIFASY